MKIHYRALSILISASTVYGMQQPPQQRFYVTSYYDGATTEIPLHLIPRFGSIKYIQGDMTTSQDAGYQLNYPDKLIQFVLRIAQTVHDDGDIQNLIGTFLFFNDIELNELQELMKLLEADEQMWQVLKSLIAEKKRSTQQVNASTGSEGTITIKAGERAFLCDKSLIPYMRTLQDFIEASGQELESAPELQLPLNSSLASADPAIFNVLIEMLKLYHARAYERGGSFDFRPLLDQIIQKRRLTTQSLANLVELINYLGIEVLYKPLLQVITVLIGRGKIESTMLSKIDFGDESDHYIKTGLIKPLMYEFQLIAIREARPKAIIENIKNDHIAFSQNGLHACAYEKERFSFVDFEKKQVVFEYDVPFSITNCVLSADGTVIVLWEEEENSDQVYLFDVHTKTLNPIIHFPSPVKIKTCALSPDNTKLCVITSQNRVIMLTGDKFVNTVADFYFADIGEHDCDYKIHWFPSSLKCVVNISDYTLQKNSVYSVGATVGTYNTHFLLESGDTDAVLGVPLYNNKALIISNESHPIVATFASEKHVIPNGKTELQYRQAEGDLHDVVLSSAGNYVLIFSDGYLDIMEVTTGGFVSDFGTIFPANFNKDDTGLWVYEVDNHRFVFYQYRTAPIVLLEQMFFKLTLQQLQMIIRICNAMKHQERIFTGFSENEKKILFAGGYISDKWVEYIRRFLYMLQATYNEIYSNFEEPSASDSDDAMDVDLEEPQEGPPHQ
jgi:hypothetical protein